MTSARGYLELGMLDDAANALEEIEPEDKTRTEVLSVRVDLYSAARKWDMVAAVASHLVKVEPRKLAGGSIWPMRHAVARASRKQKRSSCERVNCIKTMPNRV